MLVIISSMCGGTHLYENIRSILLVYVRPFQNRKNRDKSHQHPATGSPSTCLFEGVYESVLHISYSPFCLEFCNHKPLISLMIITYFFNFLNLKRYKHCVNIQTKYYQVLFFINVKTEGGDVALW